MNINLIDSIYRPSYLWMIPEDPPSDNEEKMLENEIESLPEPDIKEKIL